MAIEPLNTDEIRETWLQQCGICDFGVLGPCTCPKVDPRSVILRLCEEIERYHATPERFADPTVVDAIEREIKAVRPDRTCRECGVLKACARHVAEHLVQAMREERLVVLTVEAADEILRDAGGAS